MSPPAHPSIISNLKLLAIVFSLISRAGAQNSNETFTIWNSLQNRIIEEYFMNDKCIVEVVDDVSGISNELGTYSNHSFIKISSIDVCQDSDLVSKIEFAIDSCCSSYVLRVTNPNCVLKAWGTAQISYKSRAHQRKSPKILAMITCLQAAECDQIVNEFMTAPEAELISNILAAVLITNSSAEWRVTMYTNNFYVPVSVSNREPKIFLDRWDEQNGFELETNLFIDKVLDLQGKELKVAIVDLLPYCELERFIGQEIELLKLFCYFQNCTIKGVADEWFWGEIFENGSGNGVIGMVFDGRADFGVGGVYTWESVYRLTDFSFCYLRSGVTLLVPKPHKVGGWLIPFLPFSPEMWLAYIISVVATGVSLYLITKASIKYTRFAEAVKKRGMFLTPVDTAFRALGLSVLQQPSSPLVPNTPIRHLFTSFEILYLVFCTIYAAELASYLTAPQYSKPIDTLEELAESGMIWLGEHISWVKSLLGVETPIIKKIVSNFRVVTLQEMDELAITGKYGLTVEKLAGGHYSERSYLTDRILGQSHVMEASLYDSSLVTILRKASPYSNHLNKLIARLLDNGLLLFWEANFARTYMSSWTQTLLQGASKINNDDELRALTLSDCLGMLLLYLAGILMSTLVFISEIWMERRHVEL